MPPFRQGKIEVDRRFDGDALRELREMGHGHRINIVDASYDIPRDSKVINFPGTTAEAFLSITKLIPIDEEEKGRPNVVEMVPDPSLRDEIEANDNHIAMRALEALTLAANELTAAGVGTPVNPDQVPGGKTEWYGPEGLPRKDSDADGGEGFYSFANDSRQPHIFVRTTDDLPFACVSLVAGHSQRTE